MSCVNTCSPIKNSLTTSTLRINQFLRTDTIVSYDNSEIQIQGLNPSLLISTIPINSSTFTTDGDSRIVYIADRRLRLVSVGEIHATASSVATTVNVNTPSGIAAQISSLNGAINTSSTQTINNALNVLNSDDIVTIQLDGAVPTSLLGGNITLTFNIL